MLPHLLSLLSYRTFLSFLFFNDTAPTEIYTLSLHDALPIWRRPATRSRPGCAWRSGWSAAGSWPIPGTRPRTTLDRKSTRLNSSHQIISYAVFCLKKKKSKIDETRYAQLYTEDEHQNRLHV